MRVEITFYSYFKDLTGCGQHTEEVSQGATLGALMEGLRSRFPKLEPMKRSTLMAVGVEYQTADYVLQEGDRVALFPPVQGG